MTGHTVEPGTAGVASGVGEQIRSMKGEPETVHSTGRKMADHGHRMGELAAKLRTIKDSEMSQWRITGAAAEKLRASIGDSADRVEVAGAIYRPVGQALSHYGSMTAHYQGELNSLAQQCHELWKKLEQLRSEYRDGEEPVPGAPGYDSQVRARQQAEADIWDAQGEWDKVSMVWNNTFVGWRKVYEQAANSLSDPNLEAIRSGEKLPGAVGLNLFPKGFPDAEDINQAGAGDCYLLSVLAGMAKGDPQKIKDMITANPDGTYTVHFADGDITVGGDQIPNDGQADWVRIIEGAYELHEGGYEEFNNGGWPAEVMADIYGKNADQKDNTSEFWDFLTGGNDIDGSYSDLEKALKDGRPVVADALSGQLGFGDPEKGGGHALTITDVYDANGVKMVELRNPWGVNTNHEKAIREAGGTLHDPDDGYFTMSLENVAKNFTKIEIANR